ncbi:nucleotidyltransferase domain-containing protein [Candidatus Woesearchaeota archaeon]|nr:nucleotidyltransferase domain-containing protein [Candidatus Woesearchaeota archaeon]
MNTKANSYPKEGHKGNFFINASRGSAKEKIISKIFEDPSKKYYVRELAREAKVNPNSVINAVKHLEKENIVKRKTRRHIVEIFADLDDPAFLRKKRIFNLMQIYDSGIADYLTKYYNPKSIILFGSYSRGEDIKKSDIDIAVITDNEEIINLEVFEKKLSRKIHLLLLQYKKINDELYASLINGISIYGYLDKK